mmetsp:Transcript_2137/g.4589  ORF Transcript_2137/g.4589 Transcript_2137/m.4589 type:complete len:203 (+) Transcript_2137:792-1400(+)
MTAPVRDLKRLRSQPSPSPRATPLLSSAANLASKRRCSSLDWGRRSSPCPPGCDLSTESAGESRTRARFAGRSRSINKSHQSGFDSNTGFVTPAMNPATLRNPRSVRLAYGKTRPCTPSSGGCSNRLTASTISPTSCAAWPFPTTRTRLPARAALYTLTRHAGSRVTTRLLSTGWSTAHTSSGPLYTGKRNRTSRPRNRALE